VICVHVGQTITCAVRTDLSKAFESGQAYVALSRVKYLDQLYLEAYDPLKVTAHPDVVNFYKELQSVDEREDR
jgi:ATP-dependent DNA helicase PIF1